jgi:hypothetical protein
MCSATASYTEEFKVPDELELLDFFGVEPLESAPEDGYWCYEVTDQFKVRARVSFSIFERSLQIVLSCNDREIMTVSQEGAVKLTTFETSSGLTLHCEFVYADAHSAVSIQVRPEIKVNWSILKTDE